jgi:hypothetical protein
MTEHHNLAANNLWADLRQWLKDNCFGQNLTVCEVSPNKLEIKTRQHHQLHLEFDSVVGRSVAYRFDNNIGGQLQVLVTIRGRAYFGSNRDRYAPKDLGQKLLDELLSKTAIIQ